MPENMLITVTKSKYTNVILPIYETNIFQITGYDGHILLLALLYFLSDKFVFTSAQFAFCLLCTGVIGEEFNSY